MSEPEIQQAAPEATEAPDAAPEVSERQALIDAAEGVTPDAPGNENGAPPPEPAAAKGKPADAPADAAPTESKISAAIRAREQAQKTRDEAKDAASKHLDEARAESKRILDEARAEAKRTIEGELSSFRTKFRDKPLLAIEEAGIDKRKLVDDVGREGSPEWLAQRRIEGELEKTRAELAEQKAWREKQEKSQEEQQSHYRSERQRANEARFLGTIAKDSPIRALYDDDARIVQETYAALRMYQERTGEVATDDDLRQYLEEQAAKQLARIRGTSTPPSTLSAAKPKANGPRTPSASSASERRGSPKPLSEMNPDELREAQKRAADDAMSAYATKA